MKNKISYDNIGLTGENSIMEGKSWEEARIKTLKKKP